MSIHHALEDLVRSCPNLVDEEKREEFVDKLVRDIDADGSGSYGLAHVDVSRTKKKRDHIRVPSPYLVASVCPS